MQDKDRHHLLLLAQNQTGYKNLLKICSDAQMQGYYYRPRIDADYLASHSEGLICTTGCLAAEVPTLLNGEKGARPQEKLALERLHWYLDVFGKDRFYIELQEHDIPSLREVNKTLLDWSKRHDVGLVVTNDVHYVEPEDARYHDVLLCVQTSALLSQTDRMRMSDGSYYLKSGLEMRDVFRPLADLPESAFLNTVRIAEMCQVDLEDKSFHLPDTDVPEGHTYETYLREMTEEGLRWRYGEPRRRSGCAGPQGARAEDHPPDGLRRLLPAGGRPVPLRPRPRHLVQRARLRRRLHRGLRGRHHRHRPAEQQPGLRALPQPRPRQHARLRPGLPRRPARGDDPLHHQQIRRGARGPDRQLWPHEGARGRARRGAGAGHPAERRGPHRQADPGHSRQAGDHRAVPGQG